MKTLDELKKDEKGMMVFAMLAVVILLLSIFAGAYFAEIRSDSQREIIDLAEFKELDREIEKTERELENLAQEAGYQAVKSVKKNVGQNYTVQELKNRVGRRTSEIFEENFEKRYSDKTQSGNLNLDFHLRPLKENQTGIEFIPLYLEEERAEEKRWSKIPGFFKVKRTVHANIENSKSESFSTRKIEIEREVRTELFILAERMRSFDPIQVRKMIDCMVSGYLNIKMYGSAFEEDVGFEGSFAETFNTTWLEGYETRDFEEREKRENVWIKNSTGFVERFTRDEGNISINSLISEEEFIYISKLAVLLEQIRSFRSYDETLLENISEYFETQEKTVLDLIGEGRGNKVNLQTLVVSLFQEKEVLSDEIFLPDLFLKGITKDGILSVIQDNEEWTDTSFGMLNDLVSGEIEDKEPWRYQEFAGNIDSVSELDSEKSYLRVLFSLYSHSMDEVLESFKVNSEKVEEFVRDEIENMKPLSWMEDVSIVGEEGEDQMTKSILHQAKNLSMSFGFNEGSYENTAMPFFYMYFLNNWGFDKGGKNGKIVSKEIDSEGIYLGVQDKITGELRRRYMNFENTAEGLYNEIINKIESYNGTEWYEGDPEQDEVWKSLNKTLEPLLRLKENPLFDEKEEYNISQSLEENHEELEDKMEVVEADMSGLDKRAKEYTGKILENMEGYPGTKWRCETYEYLYEEGGRNQIIENYLNLTDSFFTASAVELTGSYNWSIEGYDLAEDIDPGERTDQSIGYRAIGSFTQEMVREFESPSPLDYSNPRNLFKVINQNLFDLKGSRKGEPKSRLRSILKGDGDPISENLKEEDIKDVSVDLTEDVVSSSDMDDIDGWWDEIVFEKSISALKDARTDLDITSSRLVDQDVREEPYSDYADASFYRTTSDILDSLIERMSEYGETISSKTRASGYTYKEDGTYFKSPVVLAPRGNLTLHEGRSSEDPSLTHLVDLEVDMDHGGRDLIQLQKISETGTRVYGGDISKSQEWVNPFSSRFRDHYSTALFVDYLTSEMEIQISFKGDTRLVSERFSSSEFTGKFKSQTHSSFTELISPLPLLDNKYSPRDASTPTISDASIDRNVFNSSDDKAKLSLEMEEEDLPSDQDIVVEVLNKRNISSYRPTTRKRSTNLHNIFDEDRNTQKTLLYERISTGEMADNVINIKFDLDGMDFADCEEVLDHIVVRIRSEIELAHMNSSRDLDQTTPSGKRLYSPVPSFSTSEQMYIFGEERPSHLDVFRIEERTKNEKRVPHNSFDLVKNIPEDSWVVRKNGFRYLIDFEEDLRYRDVLSGTCRGPHNQNNQDQMLIDLRYKLEKDASTSYPIIPENGYGYLLRNEFLPLYMSSSGEDENFYPDRMMPLTDDFDRVEWNSLHETLRNSGYSLSLEKENGVYLHYDVGGFNGPKRVDNSFERTKHWVRESYQKEIFDFASSSSSISQSCWAILRRAELLEDFAENESSQRRSIFLAANFGKHVRKSKQFRTEHEDFTLGPLSKSLDLIGENRTEILLSWFEEERRSSLEKELRAFLSLNEGFIRNLPNRTDEEDYKDALDSLDKKFEGMDFVDYRTFSIKDMSDIESLQYLQKNFEDGSVSLITGAGVTPSALKELYASYQIDFERFADSIENLSDSDHLPSVVQELNSREYERMMSLYMAGSFKDSRVEWMPFGEAYPYLLVDGNLAHTSIRPVGSNSSVKEFIDETLKDAVDKLSPERGMILMEVTNVSSDEIGEIDRYIQKRVEHHDPLYRNISWVEFRVDGETEYSYLHL